MCNCSSVSNLNTLRWNAARKAIERVRVQLHTAPWRCSSSVHVMNVQNCACVAYNSSRQSAVHCRYRAFVMCQVLLNRSHMTVLDCQGDHLFFPIYLHTGTSHTDFSVSCNRYSSWILLIWIVDGAQGNLFDQFLLNVRPFFLSRNKKKSKIFRNESFKQTDILHSTIIDVDARRKIWINYSHMTIHEV